MARHLSDAELVSLLASLDVRDRKDGLQAICDALETGYELRLENNLFLARLIAEQRNSTDEVLRRWFYKYVGLRGAGSYLPLLLSRATEESDPQTVSWIIGATVALLGLEPAVAELRSHGVREDLLAHARTFGAYFRPDLIDKQLVQALTASDDDLLDRWASFLSSRWRESELQEYVRELNLSLDAEVAEFSVWSVSRSSGHLVDTRLEPDIIPDLPSQVRRWCYYLIAADADARLAYFDLISKARGDEPDERVREGLATGLVRSPLRGRWAEFAIEWSQDENSDRVRRILDRATHTRRSRSPSNVMYRASGPRSAHRKGKKQRAMFGLTKVDTTKREMVYFLAIDTVSFSEASDDDQLSIVKSLLSELAGQTELLSLPAGSVVSLFTGDGVIIGIRGEGHAFVPLRSALTLLRKLQTVYRYEARLGLNSGSVYVLSMSDGSVQLIGHAINQSVRVMTAAASNGVVVSDAYYNEVLHQGREPFPGYDFVRRDATDKHGNAFVCYDVVEK